VIPEEFPNEFTCAIFPTLKVLEMIGNDDMSELNIDIGWFVRSLDTANPFPIPMLTTLAVQVHKAEAILLLRTVAQHTIPKLSELKLRSCSFGARASLYEGIRIDPAEFWNCVWCSLDVLNKLRLDML